MDWINDKYNNDDEINEGKREENRRKDEINEMDINNEKNEGKREEKTENIKKNENIIIIKIK